MIRIIYDWKFSYYFQIDRSINHIELDLSDKSIKNILKKIKESNSKSIIILIEIISNQSHHIYR